MHKKGGEVRGKRGGRKKALGAEEKWWGRALIIINSIHGTSGRPRGGGGIEEGGKEQTERGGKAKKRGFRERSSGGIDGKEERGWGKRSSNAAKEKRGWHGVKGKGEVF